MKKYDVRKKKNKFLILLFLFLLISILIIPLARNWFNNSSDNKDNMIQRIPDTVIFPGSAEKLFTRTAEKITVNYTTNPGITYQQIISYYLNNLPQNGWKKVSSSDVDAVFEKGSSRLRIWILYIRENNELGVDYILDYTY